MSPETTSRFGEFRAGEPSSQPIELNELYCASALTRYLFEATSDSVRCDPMNPSAPETKTSSKALDN